MVNNKKQNKKHKNKKNKNNDKKIEKEEKVETKDLTSGTKPTVINANGEQKQLSQKQQYDFIRLAIERQKQLRKEALDKIEIVQYKNEQDFKRLQVLIEQDLSEPYSIFTYRFFLDQWPELSFLAMEGDKCVGTIVCKLEKFSTGLKRGYIAMLAVEKESRRKGIASKLVVKAVKKMKDLNVDVVVLETEIDNKGALSLYERLGFVREKFLSKYYLNGNDAYKIKLWITSPKPLPNEQ